MANGVVLLREQGNVFILIEGVQLLCLIDKGLDACRYLQTYGEWNQAAWLAKVRIILYYIYRDFATL